MKETRVEITGRIGFQIGLDATRTCDECIHLNMFGAGCKKHGFFLRERPYLVTCNDWSDERQ